CVEDRTAVWDGPLIGRSDERRRLALWLFRASKTGGSLKIVGSEGSGLSRFAREAASLGRAEGGWGHFWPCRLDDGLFAPLRRPLREMILRKCRAAGSENGRPTDGDLLALLGGPALWNAPGRLFHDAAAPLARALASFLLSNGPDHPLL